MGNGRQGNSVWRSCARVITVACSGDVSESPIEGVFGLSAACAPVLIGDELLVSPGQLVVEQPGEVSGVRLVFDEPAPAHIAVNQWRAASGLRAGDLTSIAFVKWQSDPLVLTPLDEFVEDSPDTWILALRVPRDEPTQISFTGVEYKLNGQTYRIEDEFDFEVAEECSDDD